MYGGEMSAHERSMLNSFDFPAMEELDPSVAEGHKVLYDREVPFELRQHNADGHQEVGTLEAIKVKILVMGDEPVPVALRIELTSENDLFFHYTHNLDEHGFRSIQEQQKLMVDFPEYPNVLVRMLNNCIKEPHTCAAWLLQRQPRFYFRRGSCAGDCRHLAVFVIERDGLARLDFIQNMEYKFVELLSCHFLASAEDVVRHHICFRYNSMKSRLAMMQARLQDVNALVKIKNPSLLLQLQKAPSRGSLQNGGSKPQFR